MIPYRKDRVVGVDQSASAPKSVSVVWAVGPPAEREAVETAQERDRRDQLTQQAQRRIEIEAQPALFRHAEHVRQADALDVIRDDRKTRRVAVDAADARVIGVAEVRQARGAFAQRELERRDRQQLRAHAQDLQQVAGRGVHSDDAFTEAV